MELLRKITLVFRRHHHYQAALAELETYSDRQLSELGLRRGDIAGLAYEMAEQRVALHEPRVGDDFGKRAGIASKLVRWVRERVAEEIRYRRSLRVLSSARAGSFCGARATSPTSSLVPLSRPIRMPVGRRRCTTVCGSSTS